MALIPPDSSRIKGRDARGRFVADTPHSGVIFAARSALDKTSKRKGSRRGKRKVGNTLSLDIRSIDPWMFSIRADVILEHVMDALLIHTRQNIISGTMADGSGKQPQLATATLFSNRASAAEDRSKGRVRLDQRGRKAMHRGYKTGFFADTIRRSRLTGSTATANTRMLPHVHRNVFLATEASRGYEYFFTEGDADAVIQMAVIQAFDASIDGDVRLKPAKPSGVDAKNA